MNLHHLKLSLYMYKFVFEDIVYKARLYEDYSHPMSKEDRAFQFMLNSMSTLNTSSLFIEFLFKMAVIFTNLTTIENSSEWIKGAVTEPCEDDIVKLDDGEAIPWEVSLVHKVRARYNGDLQNIKTSIHHAYEVINKKGLHSFTVESFRSCRTRSLRARHYQGLRAHIFQSYFNTSSVSRLKVKEYVYGPSKTTSKEHPVKQNPPVKEKPSEERPLMETPNDQAAKAVISSLPCLNDSWKFESVVSPVMPSQSLGISSPQTFDEIASTLGKLSIILPEQLRKTSYSILIVKAPRQHYHLYTSPFEVYSVAMLRDRLHERVTFPATQPTQSVEDLVAPTTVIASHHTCFIDDEFSVLRSSSEILGRHTCKAHLPSIVRLVLERGSLGKVSSKRQWGCSKSLDFGVDARFGETKTYGSQHFKEPSGTSKEHPVNGQQFERARLSIGQIIDWLWVTGNEIQSEVSTATFLGGNEYRNKNYGAKVRSMFGASFSEFESVTVIVTILTPLLGGCKEHQDNLNDIIYSYSKTLAMNAILIDDPSGNVYLLQVICNFRSTVRNKIDRNTNVNVGTVVSNLKAFRLKLRREYSQKFNEFDHGREVHSFYKNPEDLDTFCLHDNLKWCTDGINKGTHVGVPQIQKPMFKTVIGVSRTLSMSMVLDELDQLKPKLHLDQLAELAFFGSFLGSQTCYAEVLRQLRVSGEIYEHTHPLHSVLIKFEELFPTIHAGVHPRFQCSSLRVLQLTAESRKEGSPTASDDSRLTAIVEVLFEWIAFIEKQRGKKDAADIPFYLVAEQMYATKEAVQAASGLDKFDWGEFRLGLFTTYVSALGIVRPGRHLHQVFVPTASAASTHHLTQPSTNNRTVLASRRRDSCTILDEEMKYVSHEMSWARYRRDLVEVYLCESMPGRELNRRDVFIQGQRIFHLTELGIAVVKNYGKGNDWLPVEAPRRTMAFVEAEEYYKVVA